ncbi:hypothetical protein G842_02016, partial [Escherichia coli HVH 190 (4-3255514)]
MVNSTTGSWGRCDYYSIAITVIFECHFTSSINAYPGGQGKITKARSPQGLTPGSFCPWLLFASYVLTL